MKNKNIISATVVALILTLITTYVITSVVEKNKITENRELRKLENNFKEDSLKIVELSKLKRHSLNDLQSIYNTISYHSKDKTHNYKALLADLAYMEFEHPHGTYYFDEFTHELLRKKEKTAKLLFKNRTQTQKKYPSTKIYKGYKNKKNKKAHKLQKKYNWSSQECIDVVEKRYWIGMSDKMAIESLGKPYKINRTRTKTRTKEQWVYRKYDMYFYFVNGTLRTVQD